LLTTWVSNMKEKSQTSAILNHLKTKGSITQLEASKLYGCLRLSSTIFVLRSRNYNIKTVKKDIKNRYGTTSNIGIYYLEESTEI